MATASKSAPSRSSAGTCFWIPRIGNFGNSGLKSGSDETPGQVVSSGVPSILRTETKNRATHLKIEKRVPISLSSGKRGNRFTSCAKTQPSDQMSIAGE